MTRVAHPSRARSTVIAFTAILWASACATEDDPIEDEPAPPGLPVEMLAAMQRDLGQTEAELEVRLRAEATAAQLDPALRDQLGAPFGGAWMSADGGRLIVGITDATLAEEVRAAGAEPQLVSRSLAELEQVKAGLDQVQGVDGSIHSWRVDLVSNSVVVEVDDLGSAAVASLVASVGGDRAVRVVATDDERPRPLYDVRGGDEYIINSNTLCSVGFSVDRGFVTAGHCGDAGSRTAGGNWIAQGTFRGSTFPGNDYAWVELNNQWASLPYVGNHSGGQVAVVGSQVAAVGSSVCRSGRTTGWRCGVVGAHDVTINYAAGPVYGATQTSACAEGGDSGGSFISGNQAQGVTSGGSGNCSTGGTTFFQPLNPILSVYGLTLKTTGGGGAKEIVSNFNGKCIDVPGASFVDGARLQMWDCNGTVAQKWTFVDGTVRAGGKCMDVAWANPANGTAIQLVNCNGNLAQRFNLTGSGDLVSVLANKCVDIDAWNSSNGAKLIIWPCAGTANQKWYTR